MSDSVQPILDQLAKSGILSSEDVRTLPTDLSDKTPNAVTDQLVEKNLLTSFQARALLEGNTTNLLLDDYVILDQLGEGGMGTVYKARHRSMDRLVALKVLPPRAMASPDAIKRFHREVQAAAKLSHPNIVSAFDAGDCNGVHFLVMELVDGKTLSEIVKTTGPMPVRRALECILEAARGLAHAHGKGVIHRDIKPSNLIVDQNGVAKILDMGLARFDIGLQSPTANGSAQASEMTQAGVLMGTVEFMSPEQALDPKAADARSDIYSLGCTLYYLLAGEVMYGGDTVMIKVIAHREDPIPVLGSCRSDVPANVAALYRKMVAKRPEDRFRNMNEVIKAIEWCVARCSAAPAEATKPLRRGEDTAPTVIGESLPAAPSLSLTEGPELPTDPEPRPAEQRLLPEAVPVPVLNPLVFHPDTGKKVDDAEHKAAAPRSTPPPLFRDGAQRPGVDRSAGAQQLLTRGANWLLSAAILVIVACVFSLAVMAGGDPRSHGGSVATWTSLFLLLFFFVLPAIFVLVGAGQLRRGQSHGLVVTAIVFLFCIMGFAGVWLLIEIVSATDIPGVGPLHYLRILLIVATVGLCLTAALKGLITLGLPEVRQAYGFHEWDYRPPRYSEETDWERRRRR